MRRSGGSGCHRLLSNIKVFTYIRARRRRPVRMTDAFIDAGLPRWFTADFLARCATDAQGGKHTFATGATHPDFEATFTRDDITVAGDRMAIVSRESYDSWPLDAILQPDEEIEVQFDGKSGNLTVAYTKYGSPLPAFKPFIAAYRELLQEREGYKEFLDSLEAALAPDAWSEQLTYLLQTRQRMVQRPLVDAVPGNELPAGKIKVSFRVLTWSVTPVGQQLAAEPQYVFDHGFSDLLQEDDKFEATIVIEEDGVACLNLTYLNVLKAADERVLRPLSRPDNKFDHRNNIRGGSNAATAAFVDLVQC